MCLTEKKKPKKKQQQKSQLQGSRKGVGNLTDYNESKHYYFIRGPYSLRRWKEKP